MPYVIPNTLWHYLVIMKSLYVNKLIRFKVEYFMGVKFSTHSKIKPHRVCILQMYKNNFEQIKSLGNILLGQYLIFMYSARE